MAARGRRGAATSMDGRGLAHLERCDLFVWPKVRRHTQHKNLSYLAPSICCCSLESGAGRGKWARLARHARDPICQLHTGWDRYSSQSSIRLSRRRALPNPPSCLTEISEIFSIGGYWGNIGNSKLFIKCYILSLLTIIKVLFNYS